jgi:hypothetical protein
MSMAKCCTRLPRKSGRSNRPKTDPSVLQLLAKPHLLGRNMTNWHLNVILDVQYNSMTTEERALVSVWLLGDLTRQNDQWSVQAKIDHRQCIFSIPYPLSKYPFTLAVEPSTQTTSIWSVNFSRAKQARNARSTALANVVSVIEQSSASLNSPCRPLPPLFDGSDGVVGTQHVPQRIGQARRGCPGWCSWSVFISYQDAKLSVPENAPDHCSSRCRRILYLPIRVGGIARSEGPSSTLREGPLSRLRRHGMLPQKIDK